MAETVLSGLRPTGRVHLGNYFGAVKNWVDLAELAASTAASSSWRTSTR